MEQTCPVCHQHKANHHPLYGILPCNDCKRRRDQQSSPDIPVEMVGEEIKRQRKEFAKSIIQPYRNGELSREYLEAFGTKNIKPTQKEIKQAKPVWKDLYSDNFNINKSK